MLKQKIQEARYQLIYQQAVYKSYLELASMERKTFSELLHF